MSWVIGCDVGTQGTKAVLLAPDGTVKATARASHRVDFPAPAHADQDPNEWVDAVESTVSELATYAEGPVSHLGISAQLDGAVAVDAALRPLHPAIIWMDRRATREADHLGQSVGEERIFRVTGLNSDSSHAGPKMMWLRDHLEEEPAWYLSVGSYVVAYLTGELAQDPTNASSTMLYDVTAGVWSTELMEAAGLDPANIPPVVASTAEIGPLRSEMADRLGLSSSTQVVIGCGDDHASAIGAGAVSPGTVADVTGTAEPIGITTPTPTFDDERLLETHRHALPDAWFLENPGFVSGGSIRWISGILEIDQTAVLAMAAASPPGARGVTFIPALSGAMTPRWDAAARGAFSGLSMDTSPEDLCRAVVEGCGFGLRDILDRIRKLGLSIEQVHVTGGGARSDVWMQMKADITGLPMAAVTGEGAALGAAGLASVAAGWYSDLTAATDDIVTVGERFVPLDATADTYQAAYERYRDLFDAVAPGSPS